MSGAQFRARIGDEVPALVRVTDLAHWNRYAAVNDEFIPIHMDPDDAKAAGQPDVFGMGNLRFGYLHAVLEDWLGDAVRGSCPCSPSSAARQCIWAISARA